MLRAETKEDVFALIEKTREMLKKPEQVDQLINQAADRKLMKALKDIVALDEKEISFEEFQKLS